LGHRGIADVLALRIDTAVAMSCPDYEAALADGWKHGVPIRFAEEGGASTGILE
jgi:hypothetical protein